MAKSVVNLLLGSILVVLVATGCGKSSEPESGPIIIRKKIAMTKESTALAAKPGKLPARTKTAKPEIKAEKPAPVLAKKGKEEIAKAKPGLPPGQKKPAVEPAEKPSPLLVKKLGGKPTYFYDPTGKPDPFKPLFVTGVERIAPRARAAKAKKPKLPLTPLQRVDLSQLKVVGVIVSPTGNKALVEEASGKGYIVSKGTYVGTNFGKVKQILRDRILVEEQEEDFLSGGSKPVTRELKLLRKVGDTTR